MESEQAKGKRRTKSVGLIKTETMSDVEVSKEALRRISQLISAASSSCYNEAFGM